MKKNYRGIGFYIGLVLIVILVWYLLGNSQDTAGAYTYAEFEKALDKDEVVAVTIQQNRVTDHRIGFTIQQLDRVMEGRMDDILDALEQADQQAKLAGEK